MVDKKPLVSICTPCYNHYKYLDDYFESIIAQTYENIELIILDDCSKDKSVEKIENWIEKLKNRFNKVIFIKHKINKGVCKSCNELISYSNGDYIKLLASDDILTENYMDIGVKFLKNNLQYIMFHSNAYIVDENFKYEKRKSGKYIKNKVFTYKNQAIRGKIFYKLINQNGIVAPTVLFRKECFEKYGLFDENLDFEDYEYWLRISLTEQIPYIDKILVYYRLVEKSLSHNSSIISINNRQDNIEKIVLMYLHYVKDIKNRKIILNNFYKRSIMESLKIMDLKKVIYYMDKIGILESLKWLFKI